MAESLLKMGKVNTSIKVVTKSFFGYDIKTKGDYEYMSKINIVKQPMKNIEKLETPFFFEFGDDKEVMFAYFDIDVGGIKVVNIVEGTAGTEQYDTIEDLINDIANFRWLDVDLVIKNDLS